MPRDGFGEEKKKVLLDETLHMAWHGTLDENHAAENDLSFRRFWVKEALSFIKTFQTKSATSIVARVLTPPLFRQFWVKVKEPRHYHREPSSRTESAASIAAHP